MRPVELWTSQGFWAMVIVCLLSLAVVFIVAGFLGGFWVVMAAWLLGFFAGAASIFVGPKYEVEVKW